ncbi:MAG: RNA-binding protein, partial [Megasphaera micronuciformis]|nr:RNA-binding protein [Megasphaera micronuciformis]
HADVLALFKDKKRKESLERELNRSLYFEDSRHANREVFSVFSKAE